MVSHRRSVIFFGVLFALATAPARAIDIGDLEITIELIDNRGDDARPVLPKISLPESVSAKDAGFAPQAVDRTKPLIGVDRSWKQDMAAQAREARTQIRESISLQFSETAPTIATDSLNDYNSSALDSTNGGGTGGSTDSGVTDNGSITNDSGNTGSTGGFPP